MVAPMSGIYLSRTWIYGGSRDAFVGMVLVTEEDWNGTGMTMGWSYRDPENRVLLWSMGGACEWTDPATSEVMDVSPYGSDRPIQVSFGRANGLDGPIVAVFRMEMLSSDEGVLPNTLHFEVELGPSDSVSSFLTVEDMKGR